MHARAKAPAPSHLGKLQSDDSRMNQEQKQHRTSKLQLISRPLQLDTHVRMLPWRLTRKPGIGPKSPQGRIKLLNSEHLRKGGVDLLGGPAACLFKKRVQTCFPGCECFLLCHQEQASRHRLSSSLGLLAMLACLDLRNVCAVLWRSFTVSQPRKQQSLPRRRFSHEGFSETPDSQEGSLDSQPARKQNF